MKPQGFITKSLESEVTIYMALFKILKGPEKKDSTGKSVMLNPVASGLAIKEGWAYVTDAGNFYVDISDKKRVKINQNADFSVKAENDSSNQKITNTYIKNVRLVSGANPSYEFIRGDNTAFSVSIPTTALSGLTANRLIYSSSATAINSTSHYADATSVAINSTSAPTSLYNLYVNGGVNLNNSFFVEPNIVANSTAPIDITATNVGTYFTVTNDPTYSFINPGSYTVTTGAPTGTATSITLSTVASYFTFTNDATYPWYMDGNYWKPKNVKDANGEYPSTDSKITLVNSSTAAVALKLSYDMRTESGCDYIYIKVNNRQVGSNWSGATSGNFTFEVPANATVEIHYRKDGSVSASNEYVKILLERYPGYAVQAVTTPLPGWAPTNITNTNTTAKTTFKAKNNCILTFNMNFNKYSSDYFYIDQNGTRVYSNTSSGVNTTASITLKVQTNDTLQFTFVRSTNTSTTYIHYAYFNISYQAATVSKWSRSVDPLVVTNTTDSTSTTTGAVQVAGGLGVAGTSSLNSLNVYGITDLKGTNTFSYDTRWTNLQTAVNIDLNNISTYFTVTNDPTYYFTNPGSYTETKGVPTGTAIAMTLDNVGSYFTFTNDATYPWYMDGNYWRPRNVKDANSEYNNTDSKITLVNSSTTAIALKLSYDMKTESSSYDYIYIKVNNGQVGSHWGGTTSGNFTFEVPANATVEIHYRKDGSGTPSGEYVKILLERYPGYTVQPVTTTLPGWTPTNITNTNTTAKTTFKAKNDCVLTFNLTYNKDSYDYFYIYRNGIVEYSNTSSSFSDATATKTLNILRNDKITIQFTRSSNTSKSYKHYVYFILSYQAATTDTGRNDLRGNVYLTNTAAGIVFTDTNKKINTVPQLTTALGGTGNTSFTANRLLYGESATKLSSATTIYADNTSLSINSTSAPTSTYNLYVNGGVNLNNALYSDNIVKASSSTVTDITASNVSTYFTVTNDPTYYFTNPGSYTETIGVPTGTAITMTLDTVGSYFTLTNDATYPWYMDGNYWRPKNVKDANSEYPSTDSKIKLVNGSTTVALKLSYDMKTESSSYDYIYIKVNNVEVGSHWGGTTSGNFTFEVPANAIVEIHYRKDGGGNPSDEYVKILLERYPGYTVQPVTTTLQGWAPNNITNTNTTAKTTFKAKNNCILTFTITYNKSYDYFYIYRNGTQEYLLNNYATTDTITTKTLQVFANDIIETRFVRSTDTSSTYKHYAYFTLGYQAASASKQNRSTYSFKITSTINSTSTTTGALVVSGGIGAAGNIYGNKVYNAVWNDYAEFRKAETLEPGRVVIEDASGEMKLSSERLQPGASIISDTFGSAMGETEECKTPIAVAGRALTYYHGNINMYTVGAAVGTGPNGTVSLMTREEIMTYPDRIIGIVSEIPSYEEWGPEHIKINGRIWIKIK